MPQPETVDATFYAVVVPEWANYTDGNGQRILRGAKVDRITQKRPEVVRGGGVVTRLTLRMDAASFLPLMPHAIVRVSAGEVGVIEVVAEDPAYPDLPETDDEREAANGNGVEEEGEA